MTETLLKKKASTIFWLGVLLGLPALLWIYAIPIELNKRLPTVKRVPDLIIKIPFLYVIVYLLVYFVLSLTLYITILDIFPFHITAMFSILFLITIATKSIIRFEKHHNFKPSNKFKLFVGLWFYILGVWSIQPKLNSYVKYPSIQENRPSNSSCE